MIAPKLQQGDELRIIAPAMSLGKTDPDIIENAKSRLATMGFSITFGKHVFETDRFESTSIEGRIEDIHQAFIDPTVKGVLAADGGYNANQLLPYLNWELIGNNPKIFGGYSDITALSNAIWAKTGLVTYSSPLFETFGSKAGFEYTQQAFLQAVTQTIPYKIEGTTFSSDDNYEGEIPTWQDTGESLWVVHEGDATGTLIGGNLCTLNLLQGTPYMPSLNGTIVMIEDDYESKAEHFDRDLTSLIQQPGFTGVRGVVIGRFETASQVSKEELFALLETKRELQGMPVIANVPFGHTKPKATWPVGGRGQILAQQNQATITITDY